MPLTEPALLLIRIPQSEFRNKPSLIRSECGIFYCPVGMSARVASPFALTHIGRLTIDLLTVLYD
jgi:hypothetical protein